MKKYRKGNVILLILLLTTSTLCSGFAAENPLSEGWMDGSDPEMTSGEGMQYNMRLSGMPSGTGLSDGSNDPEEPEKTSGDGKLSFSDVMDEEVYYYRPVYTGQQNGRSPTGCPKTASVRKSSVPGHRLSHFYGELPGSRNRSRRSILFRTWKRIRIIGRPFCGPWNRVSPVDCQRASSGRTKPAPGRSV